MGINKPDVRVVVHYDVPDCTELIYRGSRTCRQDGKRSLCGAPVQQQGTGIAARTGGTAFSRGRTDQRSVHSRYEPPADCGGTGEGMSYDFDMAAFAALFKLDVLTVNYAIKATEQEGIISYKVFFNPSSVVFTTSQRRTPVILKTSIELELLIKGAVTLLHEGIFDFRRSFMKVNWQISSPRCERNKTKPSTTTWSASYSIHHKRIHPGYNFSEPCTRQLYVQ